MPNFVSTIVIGEVGLDDLHVTLPDAKIADYSNALLGVVGDCVSAIVHAKNSCFSFSGQIRPTADLKPHIAPTCHVHPMDSNFVRGFAWYPHL